LKIKLKIDVFPDLFSDINSYPLYNLLLIMRIKQFRYSQNNLGYLVYSPQTAVAVDGGAVDDIITFADRNSLKIKYIANTHNHYDHMEGTESLLKKTGAEYLSNLKLRKEQSLTVDDEVIKIYHTPGHTMDSIVFHHENFLISGDTLFNGTIGNCYSGDMESYFKSLKFILTLPPGTIIYPGHDLIKYSMGIAANMDPDNERIELFLKNYDPNHIFSSLKDELRINPFIRFNDPHLIEMLKDRDLPAATEFERWKSLMTMH